MNPLISVIIPFFNRESLTINALNSVLNQTYDNVEIILVNDGSTEKFINIHSLVKGNVKLLKQNNLGPAAARNLGMQNANGKYIAFLDSDDLFFLDKLEVQVSIHEKFPNVLLSHTSYQTLNLETLEKKNVNSGNYTGQVYPEILKGSPIASSTVMVKKNVVEKNIFYDEKIKIAEDLIFYSKIARISPIIGINIPLSEIRISSNSHVNRPEAQIIGSRNLIDFLKKNHLGVTNNEYNQILSDLYLNLIINLFKKKD